MERNGQPSQTARGARMWRRRASRCNTIRATCPLLTHRTAARKGMLTNCMASLLPNGVVTTPDRAQPKGTTIKLMEAEKCDSDPRGRWFIDLGSRARRFAHRASVNLEEDDLDNIEEESFRNDDIERDAESEHSRHNSDTEQSSTEDEGRGGARRRRRRRPPTASRLKGPRKQKSFAYKLLKRGLANLMSPTSTSGVAPPLVEGTISTLHNDDRIDPTTGDNAKPEMITFYNKTKGGVDVVDRLIEEYSVARVSCR
ncbi:hypothetical protein EVAR_70925_1 [Eumeta japonica]|uniref:Uncharacterized protein n=1 Tax=Eumeta variegata TaxID=151549 RepID=A0A4C1T640_EUMVA|nr:hypothetical protein EVAR_70925_1 [Eumeta japonica]